MSENISRRFCICVCVEFGSFKMNMMYYIIFQQ